MAERNFESFFGDESRKGCTHREEFEEPAEGYCTWKLSSRGSEVPEEHSKCQHGCCNMKYAGDEG
jgi:hypothetical protein